MNNPASQLSDQSTGLTPRQDRNAFRVAMILLAGHISVHAFFIYLAFQTGAWQLFAVVGLILLIEIVTLAGIVLIRRGRSQLGIGLAIGVWLISLVAISSLVAGLGLLFAFAALILVSTIASQALVSQKSVVGAIVASVFVGMVLLLLDLYLAPAYRFQLTIPVTFLWLVVMAIGLAYSLFIARQFVNYTLRTKLIVAFIVVSALSVAAVAFLANRSARTALTGAANQALFGAARQTAIGLDVFIFTNLRDIEVLSRSPSLVKFLQTDAHRRTSNYESLDVLGTLRSQIRKDPDYISSYALLDTAGLNVLDTSTVGVGLAESDQDYFRVPFETGQSYVSPVQFSPGGQAYLYFSSPLYGAAGNIVGVIRVRYDAAVLQALLERSEELAGKESFAILLDEHHLQLAHGNDPELAFKTLTPLDPVRLAELQASGRLPEGSAAELSLDLSDFAAGLTRAGTDEPYFAAETHGTEVDLEQIAVVPLETQPWLVAFSQPQEVFLAPIQAQTQATLLLVLGVIILAALVAFGFGQFLARPIIHLTGVARQVAAGDLAARAPIESRDETGQLAETFNQMTAQLRDLIGSLESQVQERTTELTLSIEVGQRAAAIRDLDELLLTITELIRQRFDLYYTQVYFIDDLGQNLVLRSGTGTVGEQLLARHHSLPVGPGSIVGRVAADAQAIVVPDTETSDIHHPNPLLPDTRSELAVPLIVEGQVIGVLDMQATAADTFTTDNLTVFEAMGTLLAISIDSARQWTLTQAAQQRSEEAVRQLTRQTWAERLSAQRGSIGFAYDLSSVAPLQAQPENGLSTPVLVQNEPIGQLSVEIPADRPFSDDEEELLSAVAQQLAQKAENLRLFEQTEQRAAREQIARQITDKVRASRDIETALKTAAEELSKALGAARTVIDLNVASQDEPTVSQPMDETTNE